MEDAYTREFHLYQRVHGFNYYADSIQVLDIKVVVLESLWVGSMGDTVSQPNHVLQNGALFCCVRCMYKPCFCSLNCTESRHAA